MKKHYIQPQTEAQNLLNLHVICSSPEPELKVGTEGGDPNVKEIF